MERKNLNSLDICKLLMAFCVIAIHTRPLEQCTIGIVNEIYKSFVGMAVPFFFLSSGYLLAQKFKNPFTSRENTAAIKKYLLKIIKMYVVWSIVYLPLAIYYFVVCKISGLASVGQYIKGFVFWGEQYNSWHLWYLLSTIYALVFILILIYSKFTPKKAIILSSIVFIISVIIDYLSIYIGNPDTLIGLFIILIRNTIRNGRILTGLFYLPLGCLLAQKQPNLKTSWFMFIGGYLLNVFVQNSYLSSFLIAISSIGFFCIVNTIKLPDSKMYLFARKTSTIVYFIHMYIWTFYYMLVYGKETFGLDCFLVTTIICLIISIIIIIIKNYQTKKPLLSKNK